MTKKKGKSEKQQQQQQQQQQRIDESLLGKAVRALIKHHSSTVESKAKPDLLGTDTVVQLQIGLEVAPARSHVKPTRILIPHPFRKVPGCGSDDAGDDQEDLEEPEVCLIVKEESKPWVQEMIGRFPEHMSCIKKVLGLQSLRTKHRQYNQRRELLHKYSVFMADDRILPMLGTALGKDFFKAKKQPVPVRLTRKEALPFAIQNALKATFMTLSKGTCVMIPIGMTNMPVDKLIGNVTAASIEAVEKIPRKWANIRSLSLKTPESTALPFYNKTPAELIEIAQLAGLTPSWREQGEDDKKMNDDGREEDAAAVSKEEKKKRSLAAAAKSPLVRALKKQKEMEGEATSKDDKQKEKDHSSSKKSKKKNRRSDDEEDESDGGESPKKKQNKKKDTEDNFTRKDKKKEQQQQPKQSFIPSKKFKGSKKGYAFKKDSQGLGYYIDAKPEVDKMALEAILRMAEQQRKSGHRHKKKGSHKRKHRR